MRCQSARQTQKGFSLIELLIVVAIILIIAAIAIPNLIRSKISANEAAAVSNIRTVNTAQTTYQIAYPSVGYANNLSKLAFPAPGGSIDQNSAGLLDWIIGCASQPCQKTGYYFSIVNASGNPIDNYGVTAVPVSPGNTGVRGFCGSQKSSITYDPNSGTNCTTNMQ